MGKDALQPVCPCGQPATVFVGFHAAGSHQSAVYCATHAEAAGIFDPHGYGLIEAADAGAAARAETSLRCPVCDCSQRDFERHGRFGCPACYGAFAGLLAPMLEKMHRGREHHGKVPRRDTTPAVVRRRIARLQDELNLAVRQQRFEGAAEARDEITALEAKLPSTGSNPGAPSR